MARPRKINEKLKNFQAPKTRKSLKPPFYGRGIGATQKLVQIVDMNVGNNLYRMDFLISVSFGRYHFSNEKGDIEQKRPK